MTHAPSTDPHASAAPAAHTLFPPGEWEALQADDRQTAKYVVCLLVGIFVLGLIGYTIVALIAAGNP
jgi:hypothetical protein